MEIVCVLDRSGSMSGIIDEARGSFNSFIEKQKEVKGEAYVTVVMFDSEYTVLYNRTPIQDVGPVGPEYFARGMTALNDAIGRAITTAKVCTCGNKKEKKLLCIVTDGAENASREFSGSDVSKMISDWRESGGETVFLASDDFDSKNVVKTLNLNPENHMVFAKNAEATKAAYILMSNFTAGYRS